MNERDRKIKELKELKEIRNELRNKCGNDFSVRDEYWLNRTEQTIKEVYAEIRKIEEIENE